MTAPFFFPGFFFYLSPSFSLFCNEYSIELSDFLNRRHARHVGISESTCLEKQPASRNAPQKSVATFVTSAYGRESLAIHKKDTRGQNHWKTRGNCGQAFSKGSNLTRSGRSSTSNNCVMAAVYSMGDEEPEGARGGLRPYSAEGARRVGRSRDKQRWGA